MKFRMTGQKQINSNTYDVIRIKCYGNDYYEVIATYKEKTDGIPVINIKKEMEDLSADEKLLYLINYYLKGNTISYLSMNKDIVVSSNQNKTLNIKGCSELNKETHDKVYKSIMYKFINDRNMILDNIDMFDTIEVKLDSKATAYGIENKTVKLSLNEISDIDIDFLEELIDMLLDENNTYKIINTKWNEFKMANSCFEIEFNDKKLVFTNYDSELKSIVIDMINKIIEDRKKEISWKK